MLRTLASHKGAAVAQGFYNDYFEYIGLNESPRLYHRWTAVSIIAALLGRQYFLPFGHSNIYPNFYILLVGDPGTRKGTALIPGKRILRASGYKNFSPDRLSPERFIAELSAVNKFEELEDMGITLENMVVNEPSELYVMMPEFADFIGRGNTDFMNLLTNLWDNLDEYSHPKLHGKSIHVVKPTINMLSATTPSGISSNIPIEAIGEGFMSRFILVSSESTGIKITFPKPVDDARIKTFGERLKTVRNCVEGTVSVSDEARQVLDRIYKEFVDIDDYRFKHYSTRRFTHLLKLCMVFSAMECRKNITPEDCIEANTLLHYTELRMPKALGEFGKAKNADVANAVMTLIRNSKKPVVMKDLWKEVSRDINKQSELIDILNNLKGTGRIQVVSAEGNKQGFLPLHIPKHTWPPELLNDAFLTLDERM